MSIIDIINDDSLSFSAALRHPVTMKRAVKVGAVVGSILVAINQADLLLLGIMPPIWKIVLTYLVPYSVSSYSSAMFIVDLSKNMAGLPDTGMGR